jgi:hypothetical protein
VLRANSIFSLLTKKKNSQTNRLREYNHNTNIIITVIMNSSKPPSNDSTPQGDIHHDDDDHPSCCRRFCDEFRLGFFDLRVAVPRGDSSSTMVIDIPNSFSPHQPQLPVLVLKFILWSLTLSDLITGWAFVSENPAFYLAYLTHWSLLLSLIYLTLSLFNSSTRSYKARKADGNNNNEDESKATTASCIIKLTWALFTVTVHAEILVTLLFWLLVYDKNYETSYPTIMSHGVVFVFLVIDGLVINRIPVRIKHFLFCSLYYLLYTLWSYIHSLTGIENPDKDSGDADTTSIYASLDWDGNPTGTLVTVVMAFVVASPILFMLLWFLALYNPRNCRFNGSNRKCISIRQGVDDGNDHHGDHKSLMQVEPKATQSADSAIPY